MGVWNAAFGCEAWESVGRGLNERDFVASTKELAVLLRPGLLDAADVAHANTVIDANREVDLPDETFPPECHWTIVQMMDDGFRP